MFARRVGSWILGALVVLVAAATSTEPIAAQGFCLPSDPDCHVEVTPDGGSTTSRYVNTGPFSFTFSLYNPSSSSVTFSLSCWFALGRVRSAARRASPSGHSSLSISP
jgi:hypothetical protein